MRTLALLFVAILTIAPSYAQETSDVVGVTWNDTLNVRAAPHPAAPVLGTLQPNATGIGVLSTHDDWSEIQFQTRRGWVASRFLIPSKTNDGPSSLSWECQGTEPFWGLSLRRGAAIYDDPEGPPRETQIADILAGANRSGLWTFSFEKGSSIGLMENRTDCSDGMSETRYTRSLVIIRRGRLLSGCCRRP